MMGRFQIIALLVLVGLAADARGAVPKGGYGKPTDCRVDALVDSAWGQTTATGYSDSKRCYNYYITNQVDAAADYAGCLAVAAGQIMRKWKFGRLVKPMSVGCYVATGKTVGRKVLTTIGGSYDWDSMPMSTAQSVPTDVQCQAVGKLMHDLAVAAASTFTPTGTFANASVMRKRLSTHAFGFANTEDVYFNGRNCPYSLELLEKLLGPSLDCGAPVILSISPQGKPAVHAAVVDGYGYDGNRLMLHANFGAWGNDDGWYYPDEGFNVGGTECTVVHECLYNLFPTNSGTAVSGRILDASRRAVAGATVSVYAGTTCVASSLTGANGVYGFVLAAGTYQVRAVCGSRFAERTLTVGATASHQFDNVPEGQYWDDPAHAPVIGNSFGNDLLMPSAYSEKAATPIISPGAGQSSVQITSVTNVTLSCTTPGAVIRYTLDGTDPTMQSPVYEAPFAIGDGVVVKAVAYARNLNPSETAQARLIYQNAQHPAGDDQAAPMLLFGTNLTRTVQNYVNYTHTADDPIVDQIVYNYNPAYVSESHSAWFRWTAPGSGSVRLTGRVRGPTETDAYDGPVYPLYGISLAVYEASADSSSAALVRTESWISGGYVEYSQEADNQFSVEQGKTYIIQCECPYHLKADYVDQFHFGGPYKWISKTDYSYFDSSKAYLELELAGNLTVVPAAAPTMTVPALNNATVGVKANGEAVLSVPGTVSLSPHVDYTVTYTANEGYQFADAKTSWTTIVRDDTGLDFSVADVDGYPSAPTSIPWNRPTSDGESVRKALEKDGFSGVVTQEVTTVAAFDAFAGYLEGKSLSAASMTSGQKGNAYLCFRLDAASVPTEELTSDDVNIVAVAVGEDGSLALDLEIEGVVAGETVSAAVIESVVKAAGGESPERLSREDAVLSGVGTTAGKVRVTVAPSGSSPARFFSRLEVVR